MKYVGHMQGSFKDQQTGRDINFLKMYVTYPNDRVIGLKAEELRCSYNLTDVIGKLQQGEEIEVFYDKFGRVSMLKPVK